MPALLALSASAGWNQTAADWRRLLTLEPHGCFGIEVDGVLAATATALNYGETLSWIGMVLTLPEYRGRGLARRLMHAALEHSGSRIVRLDASDMGKTLYEQLGFVAECRIERWRREPGPAGPPPPVEPFLCDPSYDAAVFGANRSTLIDDLAKNKTARAGSAYAVARPGANAAYFGPCISETADDARTLLRWFVSHHEHEASALDLFPHHDSAASLAAAEGFEPVRRLTRMVRRPHKPGLPDRRIYSIAGFELG
jgi:GNAT superfamily N-acetyltransferase